MTQNDALIAFVIFQTVFFFLDIYVYSKTNRDIARKGEYTFFCALIIIHMFYLIMNSLWSLQEYGILKEKILSLLFRLTASSRI